MRTFLLSRSAILILAVFSLAACGKGVSIAPNPAPAPTGLPFQPLAVPASQYPNAIFDAPTGIRNNFITFYLQYANGSTLGVIENRSTNVFTTLTYPGSSSTAAYGPDVTSTGYRAVGNYIASGSQNLQGFVYDSSSGTYTTLNPPAAFCAPAACNNTIMHSIYGDATYKTVGNALSAAPPSFGTYPPNANAFLYDSATSAYRLINVPGALDSTAYGIWIDGSTVAVAGGYSDLRGTHGYVRDIDGTSSLTYDHPGSVLLTHFEGITGAGGPGNYNVIGDYTNAASGSGLIYGFFLPIRNWQAGTPVELGEVSANSVFQQTVIGVQASGSHSGYIVTVP